MATSAAVLSNTVLFPVHYVLSTHASPQVVSTLLGRARVLRYVHPDMLILALGVDGVQFLARSKSGRRLSCKTPVQSVMHYSPAHG